MNPNVLVLNYANKCGANGAKACDPTYLGTLIDEHVEGVPSGRSRTTAIRIRTRRRFSIPRSLKSSICVTAAATPTAQSCRSQPAVLEVDYSRLNSAAYADLIGIDDPANPART